MASLTMEISHQLPKDEALNRVKQLLGKVKVQYADSISDLKENWNGYMGTFNFKVKGLNISGTLSVKERKIILDGTIPMAALLFKSTIKNTINEEAAKLLS